MAFLVFGEIVRIQINAKSDIFLNEIPPPQDGRNMRRIFASEYGLIMQSFIGIITVRGMERKFIHGDEMTMANLQANLN